MGGGGCHPPSNTSTPNAVLPDIGGISGQTTSTLDMQQNLAELSPPRLQMTAGFVSSMSSMYSSAMHHHHHHHHHIPPGHLGGPTPPATATSAHHPHMNDQYAFYNSPSSSGASSGSFIHPSLGSPGSGGGATAGGTPTAVNCNRDLNLTPPMHHRPHQLYQCQSNGPGTVALRPSPVAPLSHLHPHHHSHHLSGGGSLATDSGGGGTLGFESLSGYASTRHSPCSPSHGYQVNGGGGVNGCPMNGYNNSNPTATTNTSDYGPRSPPHPADLTRAQWNLSGLISPGVSMPVAVPGGQHHHSSVDMTAQYWARLQ